MHSLDIVEVAGSNYASPPTLPPKAGFFRTSPNSLEWEGEVNVIGKESWRRFRLTTTCAIPLPGEVTGVANTVSQIIEFSFLLFLPFRL